MHDFVYKNKRFIQVILALIFLPFAFVGVDSYFRGSDGAAPVATIGGQSISQQEFNISLRERQEMLQNMTGGKAPPSMLDNPEMRASVLDEIVSQRVLLQQASRSRMTVTDQQVQAVIGQAEAFQDNGKFSMDLYERFLKLRNRSAVDFESEIRRDLLMRQLDDAYTESNFLPRTVTQRLIRLTEQQRETSFYSFAPEQFESQVKLEADAAKKYYDSKPEEFHVPEQVRVEYVVLSIDMLLPQETVDPEEVKKAFDEFANKNQVPEVRQASHILIAVDAKATAEEKQKARAKAENVYKQVKAKPGNFAELAKQYSQDPGSAEKGGDLGTFKRGDMVKAFSDAAFQMKTGDISAPVESEYGYHIIKLTGITQGKSPSFESMRAQLETELKKQRAGRKFAEMAEQFNNMVFEQSESLKPAAEFAKSAIRQSGWISRNTAASEPQLNNPKLLQAIFSDDVLRNKRNSEAVEVAPGVLVAARMQEYKPASVQPFDQVQSAIVTRLTRQRATQLAAQEGRATLEKLRQGKEAGIKWSAPQMVNFSSKIKDLSDIILKQALKTDTSKLPAYSGVEDPQRGYTLVRITRAVDPEKIDPEKEKNLTAALQQALGREQYTAYIASLRQKADVKIKLEQLMEKKDSK